MQKGNPPPAPPAGCRVCGSPWAGLQLTQSAVNSTGSLLDAPLSVTADHKHCSACSRHMSSPLRVSASSNTSSWTKLAV